MVNFKVAISLTRRAVGSVMSYFLEHRGIAFLVLILSLAPLGSGLVFVLKNILTKSVAISLTGSNHPEDIAMEGLQKKIFRLGKEEEFTISVALQDNLWTTVDSFHWDFFNEIEAPFDYPEKTYLRPHLGKNGVERFDVLLSPKCHSSFRVNVGDKCTDMLIYLGTDRTGDWCTEADWTSDISDYFAKLIAGACSGSEPASVLIQLPLSGRVQPDWHSSNGDFYLRGRGKLREKQVGQGGNVLEVVWIDD